MKTISQIGQVQAQETATSVSAVDTTFVLFFLAIEFGQILSGFSLDIIFLAITLGMFIVLPYFLPSDEKTGFANWIFGRCLIAGFAIFLGWIFKQSVGVVFPETFGFLPLTLLIVTAMVTCYIQFYGFLKLREVK
ncbi:MAG: hypothetical protein ACR2L1_01695 [Pyrinomonadaceae bacterium]